MKHSLKLAICLLLASLTLNTSNAQTTFYDVVPGTADASWKVISLPLTGYVLCGNKYFNSPNPNIYMTKFDEFGVQQWTQTHATGLNLTTFWKNWRKSSSPLGFFVVQTGSVGAQWQAFAMTTNTNGQRIYEKKTNLPTGTEYAGCVQATNGGYIAVGRDANFNMVASRYNSQGDLLWHQVYPGIGWAWSVAQAPGGGYLVAGSKEISKIDVDGNLLQNVNINLPNMPGGIPTTFGEFEEIYVFKDGSGFLVTGSCFGGQYTSPYTARFSNSLGQSGGFVLEPTDFNLANNPVAWIGNAVYYNKTQVLVNWRRGPVTSPATSVVRGAICNNASGGPVSIGTLTTSVSPREAFMVRDHGAKYVLAGTTSDFRWFSWITTSPTLTAPQPFIAQEPAIPSGNANELTVVPSKYNSLPGGGGNFGSVEDRSELASPFLSRTAYTRVNVFPNPATDKVAVGGNLKAGSMLRILAMDGRTVLEREVQPGELLIQLDVASLQNGIYSVQVADDQGVLVRKFSKN